VPDKSWKAAERKVAGNLGGKRNPLSGRAGGHTSGDVIHPAFYVEVKQRKRFAVLAVMRDTEVKAKREGKEPLLVLHEARARRRYYVLPEALLLELVRCWQSTGERQTHCERPRRE
jgi:hypothetical protein